MLEYYLLYWSTSVAKSGVLPFHSLVAKDRSERRTFPLPSMISYRLLLLHLIFIEPFRELNRNMLLTFRMYELLVKRMIRIFSIKVLLTYRKSWPFWFSSNCLVYLKMIHWYKTIKITILLYNYSSGRWFKCYLTKGRKIRL